MKFFIDTADIKEIKEAAAMGLVDGVRSRPRSSASSTTT
jgi:transaldolase